MRVPTLIFIVLLGAVSLPTAVSPLAQGQDKAAVVARPEMHNALAAVALADRIRLRWDLPTEFPAGGYRIYRDNNLLTASPLRPLQPKNQAPLEGSKPSLVDAYLELTRDPSKVQPEIRARMLQDAWFLVMFHSADDLTIARDLGILYDDTSVVRGRTYIYRLVSVDAAGRETEAGSLTVRFETAPPPPAPSQLSVEAAKEGWIGVRWEFLPPRAATEASIFRVYRSNSADRPFVRINADPVLVLRAKQQSSVAVDKAPFFQDKQVEDGRTYYYNVVGVDFFGRESAPTEVQRIEFQDPRPPLAVEGLSAKATAQAVTLSWTVPQNGRIARLWVTRSESIEGPFEPLGEALQPTAASFTDKSVLAGRQYYYRVTSENRWGKSGDFFPAVLATVVNPAAPRAVLGVTASARPGEVTLHWQLAPEADLAGYRIYRSLADSGSLALVSNGRVTGTEFTDRFSPQEGGRRWYRVTAVNTSNQESEKSSPATIDLISIAPPLPPLLSVGKLAEDKVLLDWQPPDQNVAGYNLYRTFVASEEMVRVNEELIPSSSTHYEDTDVEPDATYYYAIEAVSQRGFVSSRSNIVSATALSNASAPVPVELRAQLNLAGQPQGVTLTWTMPAGQRLRCAVYRAERQEGPFRRISSYLFEDQMSFTDPSVLPGRTYFYAVRARTPGGPVSGNSNPARVGTPAKDIR